MTESRESSPRLVMQPNWRRFGWGGLVLTIAGAWSYFSIFATFPVLRDFPWVNIPLVIAGVVLAAIGMRRAWGEHATVVSRMFGSLAFALALLVGVLFHVYVFWMSYQLPAIERVLAVGDAAPEFTLPNQDDEFVSLADLRGQRVLLLFYRGHW